MANASFVSPERHKPWTQRLKGMEDWQQQIIIAEINVCFLSISEVLWIDMRNYITEFSILKMFKT